MYKGRAHQSPAFDVVDERTMNDEQLLRYSRHIPLDEVGIEGQERVLASHAHW